MQLNTWHTLTGVFLLICFSGKVYLHALLDSRQQRSLGFFYSLLYPVRVLAELHTEDEVFSTALLTHTGQITVSGHVPLDATEDAIA